jgi:N-acyl-phosphatidylethanolamine-hydrolysing phospholipase D
VQLTRDQARTALPPVVPLDFAAMERSGFAVAWLGHSTQLLRIGTLWVLIDPTLHRYVGPLDGFGPKRLTPLPYEPGRLPRIDVVLISHDHFDHLDLRSIRQLSRQSGGPPRFLVGRGVAALLRDEARVAAEDFAWWQQTAEGAALFTFVPAQHSGGRGLRDRDRRLWGGWSIEHAGRRFYYVGDTAYSPELVAELRARLGKIDLAALPIGPSLPRALMRGQHITPTEALRMHREIGAARSIGVHWATFQLGDEEPIEPAREIERELAAAPGSDFRLLPIGGWTD